MLFKLKEAISVPFCFFRDLLSSLGGRNQYAF